MNCPFIKDSASVQNIKNVMKQACTDVYHLLENISYNFKINGVNFNATEFYKVIIRIATPIELLSQYHLVDNEALIIPPQQRRNLSAERLQSMPIRPKITPPQHVVITGQQNDDLQIHDIAYPMRPKKLGRPRSENKLPHVSGQSFFPTKMPQSNLQTTENFTAKKSYNKVDPDMEKLVYDWCQNNLRNNKKLQISDICRYAKSVSKNDLFQASSGWCANFLKRHLELRPLLRKYDDGASAYLLNYSQNYQPPKISSRPDDQLPEFYSKQDRMFQKKVSKSNVGPSEQYQFSKQSNNPDAGFGHRYKIFPQNKSSTKVIRKNSQSYESDEVFEQEDEVVSSQPEERKDDSDRSKSKEND